MSDVHVSRVDDRAAWDARLVRRVARLERSLARAGRMQAGRNMFDNARLLVAQRAVSASLSGSTSTYHTADRWRSLMQTLGVVTQSLVEVLFDADVGVVNALRHTVTTQDSAPSPADRLVFWQPIEGYRVRPLVWGTSEARDVTLGFWTNASFAGTLVVEVTAVGSTVEHIGRTFDYGVGWQWHTWTIPGNTSLIPNLTTSAGLQVLWWLGAGSDYTSGTLPETWGLQVNANRAPGVTNLSAVNGRWVEVAGMQLELGTPTPVEPVPYDVELRRCERYAQAFGGEGTSSQIAGGFTTSGTDARIWLPFRTAMRVAPTEITRGPIGDWEIWQPPAVLPDLTAMSLVSTGGSTTRYGARIDCTVASGLTTGMPCFLRGSGANVPLLIVSADL